MQHDEITWIIERGAINLRLDGLERQQQKQGERLESIETKLDGVMDKLDKYQFTARVLWKAAMIVGGIIGFLLKMALN